MGCEWDARKSEKNLQERGFDFEIASAIFNGPILIREDTRRDYGERRFVAIGQAGDVTLTVAFTRRIGKDGETVCRIISARRSNKKERGRYEKNINKEERYS
jgi:hypothetical protein